MNIQNANNNALGTSSHKSDGVDEDGDKNSPLTLSSDGKKQAKETRNTKMSKMCRTKAKVTPLPLSIDSSMNGSMRERLPAVTVTTSINAASPQAEMTIEQVSVDEAPPLPLTFQEQQQDREERLRLPAVTVTPSITAASPQAEMTIEQVSVDEAPPLPLTFQEQQEEDHKEKLLLRDRGREMTRIDVSEDRLTEGSMRYTEEEDLPRSMRYTEEEDLPNGTGGVASVPKFYAVEAKLVDESSASSDVPIYDAVLVVPWWKRRKVQLISAIVTMLLLAVIAIIAWAASRPPPHRPLNCSAMSLGAWYDEDCNATCDHVVIVNQDITIAYRANSGEKIQISSVSADGGTSQLCWSHLLASHAPEHYIQDMALSENTIAAGIPWAGDNFTGIVSMFERNSSSGKWKRTIPIIPDNIDKTAHFGSSVSIDGSVMAVGAPDDGETGAAFIYRKVADTWAQVAKVFGEQYTEDFGSSVIVKENLIVVSDHAWTDPNNSDDAAGAVFLYRFDPVTNSMKLEETLINKDCNGKFGSSVALQDEADIGLFVGCPDDDTATGAVYYYKVNTSGTSYEAVLKQKIRASTPEPLYRFGDNVAFGGKYLAVGTHRDEAKLHEKVHIFTEWEDRWIEVLVIDSPQGTHWFGFNIAMYNKSIVISSWDNVYSYQLTCVDV